MADRLYERFTVWDAINEWGSQRGGTVILDPSMQYQIEHTIPVNL